MNFEFISYVIFDKYCVFWRMALLIVTVPKIRLPSKRRLDEHVNNADIVFCAEIVWTVPKSTAPPETAALEILLFGNTGLLVNVFIPPIV